MQENCHAIFCEMDHLKGRVAVITGASAGIGAATTIKLVKAGLTVVGIARRLQRLQVPTFKYIFFIEDPIKKLYFTRKIPIHLHNSNIIILYNYYTHF